MHLPLVAGFKYAWEISIKRPHGPWDCGASASVNWGAWMTSGLAARPKPPSSFEGAVHRQRQKETGTRQN